MTMRRPVPLTWLSTVVLIVVHTGCSDPSSTEPASLTEEAPLTTVMPDLAPEPRAEGSDRYVPVLERVARRSIEKIREKRGEEAAAEVIARATELRAEVRSARESGDAVATRAAQRELDAFFARLGLRVFGPRLARHVARAASEGLTVAVAELRVAREAGRDVTRLADAAQRARRHLAAAREAWSTDRHVAGLVHAAYAFDLVSRIRAAL